MPLYCCERGQAQTTVCELLDSSLLSSTDKEKKMQVFLKLWGFHYVKDLRVPALAEL